MSDSVPIQLVERQFTVAVPPERVFAALSEREGQKRWFTEHSRAHPRPYGSNAFWGRHSFWADHIKRSRQYFTRFDPPRRLAYHWQLESHRPSEIDYQLEPVSGGTRIRLSHKLLAGKGHKRLRELAADFWRVATANLLWYLETGEAMLRVDYPQARGDVDLDLELDAPPERVFAALTAPAEMNAWLACEAEVDARPGGTYDFGWTEEQEGHRVPAGPRRILELEAPRLLSHDWFWPGEDPKTQVHWNIAPRKEGSLLRLQHLGFAADRDSIDYVQGWASFLCALKLHLERELSWR